MKLKLENDKTKNLYMIIAFIHFAISFFLDTFLFKINIFIIYNTSELIRLIIMKLISLMLYVFLWQKIGKIINNIRYKDDKTLKMLKYFFINFGINIVLLILTWPGIWRWDEFNILHHVSFYKLEYWQNYMTSIFYLLSYMLIPVPSGVIIIQMAVASGIVSYIIYNFSKIFKNSKLIYLLYIPFLLLPVLDHNLYPLRLTLYSYIELLLICQMIFIKKLGKCEKKDFLALSIILIILCSYRTEGIVFMALIPFIYVLMLKKEIPNIKQRILYIILTFALSLLLIIPQESVYKKTYSGQYEVTSYVNQLHVVVKNELDNNPKSDELKTISKVINMKELMKYSRGIYAHNVGNLYKENTTEEDYSNLKKAYNKLLLKYPLDVIKERMQIFLTTSGFVNDYNVHVEDTRTIYTRIANRALLNFRTQYRTCYTTNKLEFEKFCYKYFRGTQYK